MARKGTLKFVSKQRRGTMKWTIWPNRPTPVWRPRAKRFTACVWMGGAGERAKNSAACRTGSNPRTALAAAMRGFAMQTLHSRKRGAFRGAK